MVRCSLSCFPDSSVLVFVVVAAVAVVVVDSSVAVVAVAVAVVDWPSCGVYGGGDGVVDGICCVGFSAVSHLEKETSNSSLRDASKFVASTEDSRVSSRK